MTDKRPTDVFNIQLLSNIKPHYSRLDIAQGQLAATAVYSVAVCWMCSILVFNKKIICNHTNNNIMSQKNCSLHPNVHIHNAVTTTQIRITATADYYDLANVLNKILKGKIKCFIMYKCTQTSWERVCKNWIKFISISNSYNVSRSMDNKNFSQRRLILVWRKVKRCGQVG